MITNFSPQVQDSHLIRRILKMISPFESSLTVCCFSVFLFLIVPRFFDWYTLFALLLMVNVDRSMFCISRMYPPIRASLFTKEL